MCAALLSGKHLVGPSHDARMNFIHVCQFRGLFLYFRNANISFVLQSVKELNAVYHHYVTLRKFQPKMTRTQWYTQGRIRQTAVSSFGVKWDGRRKRRVTRDACISSIAWRAYFTHSLIFGRNKRLLAVKGGIWRRVFHHVVPRGFSRGFGLVILRSQIVFPFLWLYL